ncbi:MAG: isochorismatase family cysteine hydrolase [Thermotogota bacterium]
MTSRKAPLLCAVVILAVAVPTACLACDTALLVIDVQNVYVRTMDLTTIDGIPLVEKLVQVLAAARAVGIPVAYIQHLDPRFAQGSPELEVDEAIAPHVGDLTVWKTTADGFWRTGLMATLRGLGVRRLLITGLATTGCVSATTSGAVRNGFETWVLVDAHSGGGTLDTLAYYNSTWAAVGALGIRSDAVDFAAFGCTPTANP